MSDDRTHHDLRKESNSLATESVSPHLSVHDLASEPSPDSPTTRSADRPANTTPEATGVLTGQNAALTKYQPERLTAPAGVVRPERGRAGEPESAASEDNSERSNAAERRAMAGSTGDTAVPGAEAGLDRVTPTDRAASLRKQSSSPTPGLPPTSPPERRLEPALGVRAEPRGQNENRTRSRRGRGPGRRGLAELAELLSARDVAVLDLLAEHRFLTTPQLQAFCFVDHASGVSAARSCRRVLQRLSEWGLVERPFRRIGGREGGSASAVWMATGAALRLRAMRLGLGAVGQVRPPGERFVAHYLAIADARLQLVQAERAGLLRIVSVQIEPRCWRSYVGLHGGRVVLKPDLAVVLTAAVPQPDAEDHWFVEIDRGTESLPTLLKQCRAYEDYRRSGDAEARFGVFPLVAWVVPDERRAERLRRAVESTTDLPGGLFQVSTPEGFLDLMRGGTA